MAFKIPAGAVIYCDIPYENTNRYDVEFDHAQFFDWACAQTAPVFVSSYEIPDARFECVMEIPKRSLINNNGAGKLMAERLYTPCRHGAL